MRLCSAAHRRWLPFWCGLCALLLGVLAVPAVAAAAERVVHYDIDVTMPPDGDKAHYRIRFQYRARPRKMRGFKFFGWDRPKGVKVTDGAGETLSYHQPGHYDQERIDWTLSEPDEEGLQTVWVEFDQPLKIVYGWRSRTGSIPWAHQFKIPVDHMTVTSHVPAAVNAPGCSYDGKLSHCTIARGNLFTVNAIQLKAPTVGSSFMILLALLAVGLGGLAWRYARVRQVLLSERGVLPPAPVQMAFAGSGYRAPPELPVAAEPQLSDEDAGALRNRLLLVVATLLPALALALLLDGRSRLPMPSVVGLGLLVWIACALFFIGRELSWQTIALPIVLYAAVGALSLLGTSFGEITHGLGQWLPFIALGGFVAFINVAKYKGWLPEGGSGSSGFSGCSSCSSCGGGGCGSSCGGCGG